MTRPPRLSTCMRSAADCGFNNDKGSLLLPMQYSIRRLHRVSGIPHVLKGLQYKKTRHRKSNVYCDAFSTMKTTNYYEQS